MSGHSTQLSCTSTQPRPRCAQTAATCRVWLDCTPPIETSVSQPCASASATRYSSLRVLLPPKASPELQSSRLAQMLAPPRCLVSRSRRWIGEGPNVSGWRGWSARLGMLLEDGNGLLGGPEGGDGLLARLVDREERRQARDPQGAPDRGGVCRHHELEPPVPLPLALAGDDQKAEHRRVEEGALAQVDHHLTLSARSRERRAD